MSPARSRRRAGFGQPPAPLLLALMLAGTVLLACAVAAGSAAVGGREEVRFRNAGKREAASIPTPGAAEPLAPRAPPFLTESKLQGQFPVGGPDEDDPDPGSPDWWWRFATVCVLISLGGIFAGLTLGLLSLDETNLRVLSSSGTPQQKAWAERIKPIRQNGHLLLVTLLLGNTVVNESLPVVLDPLVGEGLRAILTSSALIVIFGEVIPQAVCSRYGLQIGAYFAWPVRILMYIMLPVTWPISKTLDCFLGKSHGVFYRRQELKELVTLHSEETNPGGLTKDEVSIIHGALSLPSRKCQDALTPLDRVFMLSSDERLDRCTMKKILEKGYSRIPIHEPGMREHVIGVLLVKRLILMDPDDEVKIADSSIYTIPYVYHDSGLADVLHLFQQGSSHIALVYKADVKERPHEHHHIPTDWTEPQPSPYGKLIGIITMEDVLEEVLQEEIIDETDVYVSNADTRMVVRPYVNFLKGAIETRKGDEIRRVASEGTNTALRSGETTPLLRRWSSQYVEVPKLQQQQQHQPMRVRRVKVCVSRQVSASDSPSGSLGVSRGTSPTDFLYGGVQAAEDSQVRKAAAEAAADRRAAGSWENAAAARANGDRRLSAPFIGGSPSAQTSMKTVAEIRRYGGGPEDPGACQLNGETLV